MKIRNGRRVTIFRLRGFSVVVVVVVVVVVRLLKGRLADLLVEEGLRVLGLLVITLNLRGGDVVTGMGGGGG